MNYEKQLKVGKTERYTYGIGAWLNGEALVSASVVACGDRFTVESDDFSDSTIGFFALGVAKGSAEVIITYTTSTRTDSAKARIVVVPADTCPV